MAHAGDLALFVFTKRREVGVDVERIDAQRMSVSVAQRFLAPGEARYIAASPADDQTRVFARTWTLKEAYLKAKGRGLSEPLNGFEITFTDGDPCLVTQPALGASQPAWHLCELDVGTGYAAAVCAEGKVGNVTCWQWGWS